MRRCPLVSLILVVKDGLPFLPEAIASVARQTYRNLELVVQDGVSTDGSLEYVESVRTIRELRIAAEPDSGVGQAYNRALEQCRGELIGTIDADNLLTPRALETIVGVFAEHPGAACIFGSSEMMTAERELLTPFTPGDFDLLRVMRCEVVPPFACSYFHRENCGDALRFDEELSNCQDYDLWLRLADREILRISESLAVTRLSHKSMTRDGVNYERFCSNKARALSAFLDAFPESHLVDVVRRHSLGGIYLWAAESLLGLGDVESAAEFGERAATLDPGSNRLVRLRSRVKAAREERERDRGSVGVSEPTVR